MSKLSEPFEKFIKSINEQSTSIYVLYSNDKLNSMRKLMDIISIKDEITENEFLIGRILSSIFNKDYVTIFEMIGDEFLFRCVNSREFRMTCDFVLKENLEFLIEGLKMMNLFSLVPNPSIEKVKSKSLTWSFCVPYLYVKFQVLNYTDKMGLLRKKYPYLTNPEFLSMFLPLRYEGINKMEPIEKLSDSIIIPWAKNWTTLDKFINDQATIYVLLNELNLKVVVQAFDLDQGANTFLNELYLHTNYAKQNTFQQYDPVIIETEKYNPKKNLPEFRKYLDEMIEIIMNGKDVLGYQYFSDSSKDEMILFILYSEHLQMYLINKKLEEAGIKLIKEVEEKIIGFKKEGNRKEVLIHVGLFKLLQITEDTLLKLFYTFQMLERSFDVDKKQV